MIPQESEKKSKDNPQNEKEYLQIIYLKETCSQSI